MKKMMPVYGLLLAIFATCVVFGVLLLRKVESMRADIAQMRIERATPMIGFPVQVEVVNTPAVEINGTVDIHGSVEASIQEPLDVNVVTMP